MWGGLVCGVLLSKHDVMEAFLFVPGIACKSTAPSNCRQPFSLFAFPGIKNKGIVDEATFAKISFSLAASGLIKGSVSWLCFASQPL